MDNKSINILNTIIEENKNDILIDIRYKLENIINDLSNNKKIDNIITQIKNIIVMMNEIIQYNKNNIEEIKTLLNNLNNNINDKFKKIGKNISNNKINDILNKIEIDYEETYITNKVEHKIIQPIIYEQIQPIIITEIQPIIHDKIQPFIINKISEKVNLIMKPYIQPILEYRNKIIVDEYPKEEEKQNILIDDLNNKPNLKKGNRHRSPKRMLIKDLEIEHMINKN